MKIRIINKGSRNQLVCERKNDIAEVADLGPALPFHDIAHFVVESQLGLRNGFYGNIYDGYTVRQLSDKEFIKTLPLQAIVAEVVTRTLQSLANGACIKSECMSIVTAEFSIHKIDYPLTLDETVIEQMLSRYEELLTQWKNVKEGEALEMVIVFPISPD